MREKITSIRFGLHLTRERSLRLLINKKRKKILPRRKLTKLDLYYPSWTSFGIVFIIVILFNIITRAVNVPPSLCNQIFNLADKLRYLNGNHFQNLIAIHAGIGTIIFSLVIFIAESMRDESEKDRARILLRQSFLFPLVIGEILTFSLFLWGDINVFSLIPIIIIGLLTILSLARIIIILLNKYKFLKIRIKLLKERLKRSIEGAINTRIGNNILFEHLKEMDLEYNAFVESANPNVLCIRADKYGKVFDINLYLLGKASELIEAESKKNGFSIEAKEPSLEYGEGAGPVHTESRAYNLRRPGFLAKRYLDSVNERNSTLLWVDKKLITDNEVISRIDKLIKRSFDIRQVDSFSDEVRSEISGARDQFINAIRNEQIGKIEELFQLYVELAQGFLESINIHDVGYSYKHAYEEIHSVVGGWEEVKWLKEDIRDIVDTAMRSQNINIIRQVGYLPFAIAARAIAKKDQYLFQEFMRFAEYQYVCGRKEENRAIKDTIFERSLRWVKEISKFIIEPRLVEARNESEAHTFGEFAIYIYHVIQNLLKSCYDHKDIALFRQYKKTALELFINFKPRNSRQNAVGIEWILEKTNPSAEQKDKLRDSLLLQRALENTEKEIETRKYQMFFGLASWILDDYRKSGDDEILDMYKEVQGIFEEDIVAFTSLFLDTHQDEVVDYWGWDWWEHMEDWVVYSVRSLEKLEVFYAVKGLYILSKKKEAEIAHIRLPHNRDFAFLAEGSRELLKTLEDISVNMEKWRKLLPENAVDKIRAFKQLIAQAKINQEDADAERKRKEKISLNRINEFKRGVIDGYNKNAGIKSALNLFGLYRNETKQQVVKEGNRLGINVIDDKAVFLESWHVTYLDWGVHYGMEMAHGEDGFILEEIEKICEVITRNKLDETIGKMPNLANIIILLSNVLVHDLFDEKDRYIPYWECGKDVLNIIPGFMGYYRFQSQQIPVFLIYSRNKKGRLMVLDKTRLGVLVQAPPLSENDSVENVENVFYINIRAFSDNPGLMAELIGKRVDWLLKIGREEEQRTYLLERVLIEIYERVSFKKDRDFIGYVINNIEKS